MAKFVKGGPSPNPSGRPKGTKSAPNLLRDGLVGLADLKEVLAVLVQKAKGGDLAAASILLDRTVPKLKPAADVAEEADVAEAITAAKIRGLRVEGALTLEALIAASMDTPAAASSLVAMAVSDTAAVAPTPATPAPAPEPTPPSGRPVRIPMPPADGADDPYNPL